MWFDACLPSTQSSHVSVSSVYSSPYEIVFASFSDTEHTEDTSQVPQSASPMSSNFLEWHTYQATTIDNFYK
jgi:hypothetical protein